jgi:hypothetical protein
VRDLPRRLAAVPLSAHARAGPRPPVHGKPPQALYAYGRDTPPTPRTATRGRSSHARGCTAIRHWSEPRRTSPTALGPMMWFL